MHAASSSELRCMPTQWSDSSGGKVLHLHSHSKNKAVITLLQPFPQQIPHSQPTSNVALKSICVAMINYTYRDRYATLGCCASISFATRRIGDTDADDDDGTIWLSKNPASSPVVRIGVVISSGTSIGRRHPYWSQTDEHSLRSHFFRIKINAPQQNTGALQTKTKVWHRSKAKPKLNENRGVHYGSKNLFRKQAILRASTTATRPRSKNSTKQQAA